jgi:hypothetical protein
MTAEVWAIACKRVWNEDAAVLNVYHELDGEWQFVCGGDEHDSPDAAVRIHAVHAFDRFSDIAEVRGLQSGERASRSAAGEPWHVEPIEQFGSAEDFESLCVACGGPGPLRIDHNEAAGEPQADLIGNVDLLCARCSADRNARTSEQWIGAMVAQFGDAGVDAPERSATKCKIVVPVDHSDLPAGWPAGIESEVLWGERVDAGSARVCNVPFATRNVALFDVVRVVPAELPEGLTDERAADFYFLFGAGVQRSERAVVRFSFLLEPPLEAVRLLYQLQHTAQCSRETAAGVLVLDLPNAARSVFDEPPPFDEHVEIVVLAAPG